MKKLFESLLNEYNYDNSKLVDSNKKYYNDFINKAPEYLYNFLIEINI